MGTDKVIKKPARPALQKSCAQGSGVHRAPSHRMARIDKQLQREISLLLEKRVKNDTARSAIVTGVECSRDLEFARVYFTTLDPARRDPVLAELRNVKGALRTMLGQLLKLRHIPALEFVVDRSPDYGERIDGILRNLGLDAANAEITRERTQKEARRNDSDDNESESEDDESSGHDPES